MCEMYTLPVVYSGDESGEEKSLWDSSEIIEDKVILETEITLRSGPNITMKIHEESRPGSGISRTFESEEDSRKIGVIKVLETDSESDFYEECRKSPRKVRFGGESVKMRTPESDSSNPADDDVSSIKITVTDAVSVRTRRSLIPVRVVSLPSTPTKEIASKARAKLHKSTPNLVGRTGASPSRIPRRKRALKETENTEIRVNFTHNATEVAKMKPVKDPSFDDKPTKLALPKARVLKQSRMNSLSPSPVHNEIEVFHNLTRSPEREKKIGGDSPKELEPSYSFGVFGQSGDDKVEETRDEVGAYDSFQVVPVEKQEDEVEKQESSSVVIEEIVDEQPSDVVRNNDLRKSLSSFTSEDEIWAKSEALDDLVKMLKEPGTCESLEAGPAALLFEALFACHHRDRLHSLADDALNILVDGARSNVLEGCLPRLALGFCKMGAPSGVRLAIAAMKKVSSRTVQSEVLEKGMGHRTREGALQILMACVRLFPSSDVDVGRIAERASIALKDRRRKVRHAALEVLAAIAQLTSSFDVLRAVVEATREFPDHEDVVRVVRTRLSRKQLPTVEMDGSVRYASPVDPIEMEWLSGSCLKLSNKVQSSTPTSSASSGTPSVNYWMRNSRHAADHASDDGPVNGRTQVWALDPVSLSKQDQHRKGQNGGVLRPVYILQPDAVAAGGRGHKKYDRGRSFSPPGYQKNGNHAPNNNHHRPGPFQHRARADDERENFSQKDPFRKSFSSDQLYFDEKRAAKSGRDPPYSFSLSSNSSTTSAGSSARGGYWHRDFRSSIPVPITSEKFKIRSHHNLNHTNHNGPLIVRSCTSELFRNNNMRNSAKANNLWGLRDDDGGCLVKFCGFGGWKCCPPLRRTRKVVDKNSTSAKKSTPVLTITLPPEFREKNVLNSPAQQTPTTTKLSHRDDSDSVSQLSLPPPRSSESESSGYFTPPPDAQPAFIKMDTEERVSSDVDEAVNNESEDCVDSYIRRSSSAKTLVENDQRTLSPSSGDKIRTPQEEIDRRSLNRVEDTSTRSETRLSKYAIPVSPTAVPSGSDQSSAVEVRRKSKSVIDLQNFLPEITSIRKTANSAPPRNEESAVDTESYEASAHSSPAVVVPINTLEMSVTGRLEKRFSRNNSRKSLKTSPKTLPDQVQGRSSSKPKETLHQALAQMENPDWETTIKGLQMLTRIARHNPEIVEHQMHGTCVVLAKQIRNLRSQVARNACHAASELFLMCKRGLDMELDEIAGPLLQRTADTNKFLRADANSALDVMCEHLPVNRAITVLTGRGCTHQNAVVRAASIRLLAGIVQRVGPEKTLQMPKELRDRVLLAAANSLADGNLETRRHGKTLLGCLVGCPGFQRALHEAVPQNTLRHIAKTLASIK
ncbi:uncharacterized protein LOC132705139 [Cylas formicarius]|uniref:uncharacterized protein LOC132705139 n=1 Tax=Cylas formicarius TaxID=197179 RepID=UPI002958B275|nr:uncharacterized protein LOC132705139 [Cylas formicarius]